MICSHARSTEEKFLSRSVSTSIKISNASPEDVFAVLTNPDDNDYYEGGDVQEARDRRTLPNGNTQWDVIDNMPWGQLTRTFEVDSHLAPESMSVTVTDSYGQVVRYDYHLTSESGDTVLAATATLEVESSAPRGSLNGQWRTDRWTRQGIAKTLGHVRHQIERQRNS
jgi:hypothetical protein